MKTVYQTDDGKIHATEAAAIAHENKGKTELQLKVQKIKETYWYKTSNKHSLTDTGVWQVKGEDPNCDLGGHHHQPTLGFVTGTLAQAIEYAAKQPSYFTWGGGGNIDKVNIVVLP